MGNAESVADARDVGDPVRPDNTDGTIFEPGDHGTQVNLVGNTLKEVHETLQSLSEAGNIGEGTLLGLSQQLSTAFKTCEKIENEAANNGALNTGERILLEAPHLARHRPLCEMLFNTEFALSLVTMKVEVLRIHRGEPEAGPKLTFDETYKLEAWGEQLANAALSTWNEHFRSMSWPPAWGRGVNDADGEPYQVPKLFRVLVCNLLMMQLDLWPTIKRWFSQFCIKGPNIFEKAYWLDDTLGHVLTVEPRIIPFIVEADHIDMNELAPRGATRRTNAPHRAAVDALDEEKRRLVRAGVLLIQRNHKGRFRKQVIQGGWRATQYKWPRENMPMPRLRHLLGGPRWTEQ